MASAKSRVFIQLLTVQLQFAVVLSPSLILVLFVSDLFSLVFISEANNEYCRIFGNVTSSLYLIEAANTTSGSPNMAMARRRQSQLTLLSQTEHVTKDM